MSVSVEGDTGMKRLTVDRTVTEMMHELSCES